MTSILLVHNESDDRAMYAEYLRRERFAVREVGTTDEALRLVRSCDVVITGLLVPGRMTPIDFITNVRRLEPSRPILVVTACADVDVLANVARANADCVLLKPCLPDTLLCQLNKVLDDTRVRLVPQTPRRSGADRRSDSRGGRRDRDGTHSPT